MPFYHITTATHDSRTSQRMVDYKVRKLRDNGLRPNAQSIWLEFDDELLITKTIKEIVLKDKLQVHAYNICGDHFHLLLACENTKLIRIIQKIKAVTSRMYNVQKGYTLTREHAPLSNSKTRGVKQNSLWTQKFGSKLIETRNQLGDTINYIKNNRLKHELQTSIELDNLIKEFCQNLESIKF